MSESTLLLRLAGPTQVWHAHRALGWGMPNVPPGWATPEKLIPTRTGLVGLLAAAQGRSRGSDMSDLMDLGMLLRIDQPGIVAKESKSMRKRPSTGQVASTLKREAVLDDAIFLAGIHGPADMISELDRALQHPVFAPYLGQRACPPAQPMRLGVVDGDPEQVIREREWLARDHYRRKTTGPATIRLLRILTLDETADLPPIRIDNPLGRREPDWLDALG